MGMLDAKNPVPARQREYQSLYKAHTRIYKIPGASRFYMPVYLFALWGTFGATLYMAGRKISGHNTWFGKN